MFTKRQSTKFLNAFTLAEVLITLGIIGIISAMTIPMLIQKYSQYVVEIKLKRFYTTMAQAITMAETDYGAKEHWYGELRPGAGENIKWFNTYRKEMMGFITFQMVVVLLLLLGSSNLITSFTQAMSKSVKNYPKTDKDDVHSHLSLCQHLQTFIPIAMARVLNLLNLDGTDKLNS